MAAIVKSFAIIGVDGYVVEVEADTIYEQPSISIVGLGDMSIKESKERLQSSLTNSKYEFSKMKVVINLAPGDVKKSGPHFELAMALGLLIQSEQITAGNLSESGFIGELSLNAALRPCTGVLPMAMAAKNAGIKKLVVLKANVQEALLVKDLDVYGFDTLHEVTSYLQAETLFESETSQISGITQPQSQIDFAEVQGQDSVIEYIVVAAAGGHNMLMVGAPGCGKSMIAQRIPTILPDMSEEETLETTKIYSVAGLLNDRGSLIDGRPFRAPHHNASTNSLIGGGNHATPGEISLAHNGVLFLDEIAEFNKKTLDALRQPLEEKKVMISRVKHTNTYPCNFMLVAAMNPCPCGYYGHERCRCTDYEVLKYRQKLSGPLIDRLDIQKYVSQVEFMDLSSYTQGKSSEELRGRVEQAREIQKKRYEWLDHVDCNAQMNPAQVKEYCRLESEGENLLKLAHKKFKYSARAFHKFLKVARTFADMDQAEDIRRKDVAAALTARDLDREQTEMLVI